MKQRELDKLVNTVIRQSAKELGWRSSRGFIFRATDFLFFTVLTLASAKNRFLTYRLVFKPLPFDDIFWKIVKLEENAKQPLSFRAAGAWIAPTMDLADGQLSLSDLEIQTIQSGVDHVIKLCDRISTETADRIRNLNDYSVALENLHQEHSEKYPNSARDIWTERLLTAILLNEIHAARSIVKERKDHDRIGGFMVGSQGFFDLADEYLQKFYQ